MIAASGLFFSYISLFCDVFSFWVCWSAIVGHPSPRCQDTCAVPLLARSSFVFPNRHFKIILINGFAKKRKKNKKNGALEQRYLGPVECLWLPVLISKLLFMEFAFFRQIMSVITREA